MVLGRAGGKAIVHGDHCKDTASGAWRHITVGGGDRDLTKVSGTDDDEDELQEQDGAVNKSESSSKPLVYV